MQLHVDNSVRYNMHCCPERNKKSENVRKNRGENQFFFTHLSKVNNTCKSTKRPTISNNKKQIQINTE